MSSAISAYIEFMALRKHFTTSYDYHKYQGKLKIKIENFEKRKDYHHFVKLARKPDFQDFILANMLKNQKIWIFELVANKESEKTFLEWKKRKESLGYVVKNELAKLPNGFMETLWPFSPYPLLFQEYLTGNISLETLCMTLKFTGMKPLWDTKIIDPLWQDKSMLIDKYLPFMQYDKIKMRTIICEKYSEESK